jgi:hypothetical protein
MALALDVVLSVKAEGWDIWGEHFVKRQPLSRQQLTIGPHPSVAEAKGAVLQAISQAGAEGRVIINVGHGDGGGDLQPTEGIFELAPGGAMTIGGHGIDGTFVDVFYDVNLLGPPGMSDMEHDLKNNPNSPRLTRWRIYQEISQAFKAARLQEVVLLTCAVGSSTEFLRKVANDWGVVIRAYTQLVALTKEVTSVGKKVTTRFYMHLANNPIDRKSAADLVFMEEEIPFSPPDTFLVGPPLGPPR